MKNEYYNTRNRPLHVINTMDPNRLFLELIGAVSEQLRALGYKKTGNTFRIVTRNNCGLIDFQRSMKDSKSAVFFTVNLAVVCGDLLDLVDLDFKNAKVTDAHIRKRLGFLLDQPHDKWWEISETTDFNQLRGEILGLLTCKAVRYIGDLLDSNSICSLWESGQSPGLTEFQRVRLLTKLKGRLSIKPD